MFLLIYSLNYAFRTILDVPDPTYSYITRWKSDTFAKGSYSFVARGSSGDDIDALASSVGDVVFFAGEATNKHHPQTVS